MILRSPSGTEVSVIGQGEMATGYDVLLDDSAFGPLSSGLADDTAAPYFAREATPSSPLSTFVGERAGGDWIVKICDFNPLSENGTYNRSQLILQPKLPTATEPVVTSALDTVDPTDGVTTLREAMAVANATNGTITFDPSLAGQEIPISTAALDAAGATAKAVRGYLSVENSTFEYNSAMSLGGAIRVVTGTAVLTNTTVVSNGAAAGGAPCSAAPNPIAVCSARRSPSTRAAASTSTT